MVLDWGSAVLEVVTWPRRIVRSQILRVSGQLVPRYQVVFP